MPSVRPYPFIRPCLLALSILTALTMLHCVTPAIAQDAASGAIRGTVVDLHDLRVPAASVALVNLATGLGYSTTTNEEGRFVFELLPPGDYSARTDAQGMSPQVTPQLHVAVGGALELEFRLAVAGAQEHVSVSGDPALVDTQPSAVSTLLDERAIAELPLNGRRFSDLALLSPGVTQDPRSLTSSTNGDLGFGGIRGFQNSFLVGEISTMHSSLRPGAAIARPSRYPRKSCRSSAFPRIPTALNSDVRAERSSTS